MALTNKQAAFVREYLVDFNATQAAVRSGYSAKTAYSIGSRLLKDVEVQASIGEHMMGAEECKARLADIARGDIADLMDITPTGFTFRLIEEDAEGNRKVNPNTKLIKKIKQKVTTVIGKAEGAEDKEIIETEIELYSALEATRDIAKIHKLFTDAAQVNVTMGLIWDLPTPESPS